MAQANRIAPALPPLRVPADRLSRKKVAIVGFTDHRKMALNLDDTWEVWGLNELGAYEPLEKFHRWFEIHDRAVLEGDPDHLKRLATYDIPVYMQRHWEDIPASVPFPKALVEEVAGTYMTSSIAWELGLAIAWGAEEIAVFGVDLAQDTEYFQQRPACEYLIGLARGRGIKVFVPETSDLLKAVGQYGFDPVGSGFRAKLEERIKWLHTQDNEWLSQVRALDAEYNQKLKGLTAEFEEKKEGLTNEYRGVRDNLLANRFKCAGAIEDCEFWKRSWSIAADTNSTGPTPDRTLDARTGIRAPAGDARAAAEPAPAAAG